uniref:Uncharacterized protein n=1 Tax=Kalanchoe fedtschenkoi TaxID=63787 RepID=A0A7N0TUN0_KALFE
MARSVASVKMFATLIANEISAATNRRGFAAVSQGVEASRGNLMSRKPAEKEPAPWIPDPVTGYYRPENVADETDVAELREMLLKQNKSKKK